MIRVGIVGAGPMGRLHGANVERSAAAGGPGRLTCVFDRHAGRAEALAGHSAARVAEQAAGLFDQVDVVIVATPTRSHFEIVGAALDRGCDVLVEKPMAASPEEAQRLVEAADAASRMLQVGQLEWYNPAWRAAAEQTGEPTRIEVERMQPPGPRGRDIDVIDDLMLHDLDWTTRLIGASPSRIEASARCVEGTRFDEARAELSFPSGQRVSLRASRVDIARRREARLTGPGGKARVQLDALPGGAGR